MAKHEIEIDFGAKALEAAASGLPVFPCDPDTKHPLIEAEEKGKGGLKLATTDAELIARWWRITPKAMIAMRCGSKESGGAGVFVIDLDPKGEETAFDLLVRLVAKLKELRGGGGDYTLPPCPIVETPRGGLHLWFKYPAGFAGKIGNRANLLKGYADNIDVRGNDGYVIIPPSQRRGKHAMKEGCDGVFYKWAADADLMTLGLPEATPEIIRLVTERHKAAGEAPERKPSAVRPTPYRPNTAGSARETAIAHYVQRALEDEYDRVRVAASGERNAKLNNAAMSLGHHVGAGKLGESVVYEFLLNAAEINGMIADDAGDFKARATIASGLRAGAAQPATYDHVGTRAGVSNKPPPIDFVPDYIANARDASPRLSSRAPAPPPAGGEPEEEDDPFEPPPIDDEGGDGDGEEPPGSDDGPPEPLDPDKLLACFNEPQNDTGNARRLLRWFGDDLVNADIAENPTSGLGVHAFVGTHWDMRAGFRILQRKAQRTAELIHKECDLYEMTRDQKAAHEAMQTVRRRTPNKANWSAEDKEAVDAGMEALRELQARKTARRKFAISSGNGPRLNHMISQALPHCTIPPEALDKDPELINVQNGTLFISEEHDPECFDDKCTGACGRKVRVIKLREHDRRDLITKVMPVTYDPAATCPRFLAFAERCQPKEEKRAFLQRWFGLSLTGITEQAFVLNYGTGANGKTTFIETIARLEGPYAQTIPPEALVGDQVPRGDQARPELARLAGARLVRAAELPRGQSFKESTIKMLTGGDAVPVRHLHGKFWDLQPIFKAVGACNEKPDIHGVDEGIWRRVKLVSWEVTIPIHERLKIEDVLGQFEEERSGILNWLLAGLLEYLAGGLAVPEIILQETDEYRADMNPVGSFIEGCVRIEEGSGKEVTARRMFESYVAYCHANSIKVFTQKNFGVILGGRGIKRVRRGGMNYYQDVELHDVPIDPDKPAMRGPASNYTVYPEAQSNQAESRPE